MPASYGNFRETPLRAEVGREENGEVPVSVIMDAMGSGEDGLRAHQNTAAKDRSM